jgi:NADH dehydrogenase
VWALGDAAINRDASGTPYPATAQHAVRQGKHLARNLARVLGGEAPLPLEFRPLGSLVALGCRSGVAKILGLRLAGFPAWWLYRTVYLTKMPGLSRKARVALDWTLGLLFPPDAVQLGVHGKTPRGDNARAESPVSSLDRTGST